MPLSVGAEPQAAPAEPLGASTDAVLADLVGLGPDELDDLHARRVIRSEEAAERAVGGPER
jgi:hypothetical protein